MLVQDGGAQLFLPNIPGGKLAQVFGGNAHLLRNPDGSDEILRDPSLTEQTVNGVHDTTLPAFYHPLYLVNDYLVEALLLLYRCSCRHYCCFHNTMFLMLMNQNLFLELVLVVLACPMYFSSDKRI